MKLIKQFKGWANSLTIEDIKRAGVRFSKTVFFSAIVLGGRDILMSLEGSESILTAIQDRSIYIDGLQVFLESLVIGLLWGADKLRRAGSFKTI